MWDDNSFDLRSFDAGSWLFDAPYVDLLPAQQVYASAILHAIYASADVEQVIAFSTGEQVSVAEAVASLCVQTQDEKIVCATGDEIISVFNRVQPACVSVQDGPKNIAVRSSGKTATIKPN